MTCLCDSELVRLNTERYKKNAFIVLWCCCDFVLYHALTQRSFCVFAFLIGFIISNTIPPGGSMFRYHETNIHTANEHAHPAETQADCLVLRHGHEINIFTCENTLVFETVST